MVRQVSSLHWAVAGSQVQVPERAGCATIMDGNGDIWAYYQGNASTPIRIGHAVVQDAGSQVVFPVSTQFTVVPEVPAPADTPTPGADASLWTQALAMMGAIKNEKKTMVRCDPDLLEAWND